MLYLLDETRERLALATDETRDRLSLTADEARDRLAYAGEGARLRAAELLDDSRARVALLAVAVVAVLCAGLLASHGSGDSSPAEAEAAAISAAPLDATPVEERGFTLSLPAGWKRTDAPDGAVFAAESAGGVAQTTLWVERDPNLDFDGFVKQSLGGLTTLGENARIVDRVDGPTIESSSAELRADVALDGEPAGPYRVNLRAAGPYRYYLATSLQAGAPASILADAELIGSSLRPDVRVRGIDAPR